MENIETLMGKYGEEGDKLIFRILESGVPFKSGFITEFIKGLKKYLNEQTRKLEYYNKHGQNFNLNQLSADFNKADLDLIGFYFENILSNTEATKEYVPKFKTLISEKALKYDLTIPFARYVAMNHNQLTFPFKRYQIQPVWRADRPQKGRYREFYQCDADVVGSNSLLNEVELANIYATVFEKLKIPAEIIINSRKILTALAEIIGEVDKLTKITNAIDKLEKIGLEKVKEELRQHGLNDDQVAFVNRYLLIAKYSGDNKLIIQELKKLLGDNKNGTDGLNELELIINDIDNIAFAYKILIDPTLARGLNYYTGIIFEVKAKDVQMGSIGGGGRYDDLTGLFGVPNIPGVGISFGVDRIYDVMEELNLFPANVHIGTQVLFFNLGENESKTSFLLMQELRNKGIRCELYHEQAKFDKQFKYAEKKNIPYVIIIGSEELKEKNCSIKDLRKGVQSKVPLSELINISFE
ncbi:MAG TPA: histidine--tRNA ligase [Chitinophagaceae bacterium]|nr:histidine--tRNA ligase [Chitinophagaceae bacterium]